MNCLRKPTLHVDDQDCEVCRRACKRSYHKPKHKPSYKLKASEISRMNIELNIKDKPNYANSFPILAKRKDTVELGVRGLIRK